jgi:hypothetical protein
MFTSYKREYCETILRSRARVNIGRRTVQGQYNKRVKWQNRESQVEQAIDARAHDVALAMPNGI